MKQIERSKLRLQLGKLFYTSSYVDGMILYYGHFKAGIGGGLCQLKVCAYDVFAIAGRSDTNKEEMRG